MRRCNTAQGKVATTRLNARGFTVIELMIAMLVASVMFAAIYTSYDIQQKASTVQRELARMELCARAAMDMIKDDLRNAGRHGQMTGKYNRPVPEAGKPNIISAIEESQRWDQFNPDTLDITQGNGFQGITLWTAVDLDNNGAADYDDPAALQRIRYRLMDTDGDGVRELRRQDSRAPDPNAWTLICPCIEDMSFAFAIDADDDEELDTFANNSANNIIWAADLNNNGRLDVNLDNDNTGTIDPADDSSQDGIINGMDGGVLPVQVPLIKARAVRIWIMARSLRNYPDYTDNIIRQVGYNVYRPDPNNPANFRRLVVSSAVYLPNRERLAQN